MARAPARRNDVEGKQKSSRRLYVVVAACVLGAAAYVGYSRYLASERQKEYDQQMAECQVAQSRFDDVMETADQRILVEFGGQAWADVEAYLVIASATNGPPLERKEAYVAARERLFEAIETAKFEFVKSSYETALGQGKAFEAVEKWHEAAESATEAIKIGWQEQAEAEELLRRARTHLGPKEGGNISLGLGQGVTMEFIWIPAGDFSMGSVDGERNERPPHKVTISHGFWIGKFEVTQRQFQAMTGKNPSRHVGPDKPVEQVSWYDAKALCDWLAVRTTEQTLVPIQVRLPTEAEWEYACRAGMKTRYYSGGQASDLARAAWYSENSEQTTHPVGRLGPNAFGLYDMLGNVWEWCEDACRWKNGVVTDVYHDGVVDPLSRAGEKRVFRGGSWRHNPKYCTVSFREGVAPEKTYADRGFRIVVRRSQ